VRIAILEDDPDQLTLLQRWLAQDRHDVHGYLTGREVMMRAGRFLYVDTIMGGILTIGVLGVLTDIAFRVSSRLLFPYLYARR